MANQSGPMEKLVTKDGLKPFYNNKKVFVTGHTGFKGSWLVALLHELDAIVKGYALPPEYEEGLYNVLKEDSFSESIFADIRNKERLQKEIVDFQPDYIFHLAAQPLVRRSYEIPSETFDVNVVGTANLLEAVTLLQTRCSIVIITTDKVYQNKEQNILYAEDDALGGYDPYSASKACAELVVNSFRSSFFNPGKWNDHKKTISNARAGNVIGGGDWSKDRLIPDIVKALREKRAVDIRNPYAVRPWQHVLEPLGGYLLLAALCYNNPTQYSPAYNFGPLPDDHLTVGQLTETAINCWQSGTWKDSSVSNQPHEAGLLKLDISKAMRELNWRPKLNAQKSIEWTIDWYKQPIGELRNFTLEQIRQYLAL